MGWKRPSIKQEQLSKSTQNGTPESLMQRQKAVVRGWWRLGSLEVGVAAIAVCSQTDSKDRCRQLSIHALKKLGR